MAVFLGDFIGYWRHRLEHTKWLWPTHAIHHSDEEMTWLTLNRFHPINRITTTVIDSAFLMAMGLPSWAVIANSLVRNYYGYFIHADLPWTYGPLGKVFVSPAMHQWHHAKDIEYAGTNFATVFSIFDRVFGTFALPGPCTVPLGIAQEIGQNVPAQLAHPFRAWFGALTRKGGRSPEAAP
jgi:sterol desaturase/sphingolipid hydroxylase (fatty acid hydroxylase superfamily)